MFQWLRNLIARRREKRLLGRYEMVFHACGCGPVALRPGEDCPFCGLSFRAALDDHIEYCRMSEEHEKELQRLQKIYNEERRVSRRKKL